MKLLLRFWHFHNNFFFDHKTGETDRHITYYGPHPGLFEVCAGRHVQSDRLAERRGAIRWSTDVRGDRRRSGGFLQHAHTGKGRSKPKWCLWIALLGEWDMDDIVEAQSNEFLHFLLRQKLIFGGLRNLWCFRLFRGVWCKNEKQIFVIFQCTQIVREAKPVSAFKLSADRSLIAIGYSDGEIHVYQRGDEGTKIVVFFWENWTINCNVFGLVEMLKFT